MTLPTHRVLQLILFTSFALCVCQGRPINCHVNNYADCHRSGAHINGAPASSIVSLVVSPADVDFPSLCSALLQCALRPMCSPHTGLQCFHHTRIRGGCLHLHHVTIQLLLQWESCGVLVLLPEHQQHHWCEGDHSYCSDVGRYGRQLPSCC